MKKLTFGIAALGAACAFAAPTVSNVVMTQDNSSRLVTVTYDLADEQAIITLDITTNGVSIGEENIYCLSGDVNRKVDAGTGRVLTWQPDKSWNGHKITDKSVRAVVKAWAKNNPPNYMVVDLTGTAETKFYTCEAALPGGISNSYYRTSAMVMRRIPAQGVTWTMGQAGQEPGGSAATEWQHAVTMDHDYYMGVFELTQGQYFNIVGQRHYKNTASPDDSSSEIFSGPDWMLRPLDNLIVLEIRQMGTPYDYISGQGSYPAAPYRWSLLGQLRVKAPGFAFDMPSEAEWEYACRAGTPAGCWNDGSTIVSASQDPNAPARASYKGGNPVPGDENYGVADKSQWTAKNGTAIVGSGTPNSWGLYDMHGNVWEACLDYYRADLSEIASYVSKGEANAKNGTQLDGTSGGGYTVVRGGAWDSDSADLRSARRKNQYTWDRAVGVRIVCPARID